jgi:hypothetical protein
MTRTGRPSWAELLLSLVVLVLLATLPLWFRGWWTALPFAAAVGGMVGGRWFRWYWSLPAGFAAGAVAWGLELALLPALPRTRLADGLGPAEGLTGTLFVLIGPVLFGVVVAVAAMAVAGALRLPSAFPRTASGRELKDPAAPPTPP